MENKHFEAPLLPVPGMLLLPGTVMQLTNLKAADILHLQNQNFVALPVREGGTEEAVKASDFSEYGVLCDIRTVVHEKDGMKVTAEALDRVRILSLDTEGLPYCEFEMAEENEDLPEEAIKEMLKYIQETVRSISKSFRGGEMIARRAETYTTLSELMVYLAQYMPLSRQEKEELLAMDSQRERALRFMDMLLAQKEMIEINLRMNEKFSEESNRYYREQALRRQLAAIQAELDETVGEEEGADKDQKSLSDQIKESDMPEKVKKELLNEAAKLETAAQPGTEQDMIRNYLEFALSLPWKKEDLKFADLKEARKILDARHYGMDKVKERIIQHLAVMRLRKTNRGSALLLVGPPGTGKTSLCRSIAEALGREYTRMSLGGVRDESEIRGHRRTYIGAMSGRVLQAMKSAGTTNPVMVLDEIDKLMQGGFSGDPAAAMLEVLDPEQNDTFTDHYLDQPYDLSDVFFIATANSLDTIPGPLLDRMEVIEISSYTADEKFHIAKEHLIPEVLKDHGIEESQLHITDEAIEAIVEKYTMEAGCRGLKKRIANIARHSSEAILESDAAVEITAEDLPKIFGNSGRVRDKVKESNPAGVVTGLAWTAVGGEVLMIETTDMPGSGQFVLTGQLGDVMKESARISMSVLKSRLPIDTMGLKDRDIHIHLPAGATPKDGPSAGITLFTALASLALNKPVDSHLAMTGELSLRGDVLPIGGLKEKLFGAQRFGITKVLIPWQNQTDLEEVPEEIKAKLEIIPVKTVEEVLMHTLGVAMPIQEHQPFASTGSFMMNAKEQNA